MKSLAAAFFALGLLAMVNSDSHAQTANQDTLWKPFTIFIGSWEGKGGGEPGIGVYTRTYQFVLNNKYIEVKNRSSYPPTKDNPEGEVHQDWGYISYDKLRHTFVLRQFHVEGFVNQYVLDSISAGGRKIIFISEAIENIKPGWCAKETYEILDNDQIRETFELAPPGKPFDVYTHVTLQRKR